jgi:hypothetical protein
MISLDSSLLDRACAVARTQWLHQLLAEHLPALMELSDSKEDLEIAKQWDSFLKQKFAERGLVSPAQQKNRITDVRNAIKVIDPHHPALNIVGFTASEWIEINSLASAESTNRTTQFLADPDAIAELAARLLQSRIWSEVAAGLAVVTGRRISEILKTAEFTSKSTYSVIFAGAVKRRDESVPLTFEIPTLVPANTVIDAIAKLRGWLDTSNMTNRQINERYEQAVAQVCDRYFRALVPLRSGKGNLYTHLFRAVYATIATHWFCPPTISDLEFRAYIQGHFQILNETNQQKRTSMAAQRHYWDYKIENGRGNVDGRLGIKLQQTGVRVLEAFERPQAITIKEDLGHKVHLRVFNDDRTHLASIQSQFDLNSRADTFHLVLELAQSLLNAAELMNLTPQQLTSKLADLSQTSDGEQTDLSAEESTQEPSMNSEDLLKWPPLNNPEFSKAGDENQRELITNKSSGVGNVDEDEKEAVDLTTLPPVGKERMTTTQESKLLDKDPQTATVDSLLLERMARQQQSMENLTGAIHSLVSVLAPSNTSSSFVSEKTQSDLKSDVKSSSKASSQPTASRISNDSSTTKNEISSRKRRGELSRQKVHQYIDRIMAYNDVLDRPHADKWLITIAALKRLTHCGQSVIYDVMGDRQSDILFHHDKHQLGQYHNQKGKNSPLIESLILPNNETSL